MNRGVVGSSVETPLVLLEIDEPTEVSPISIQADIEGGRYVAAMLIYPDTVTGDVARYSIERTYGQCLTNRLESITTWRCSHDRSAIVLYETDRPIRVGYFAFQSTEGDVEAKAVFEQ
ncbi:MAG: hypothetical protein HY270_09485 [Deltaproteobacteria bacterium]|nr:hypothetical protein [Deltaproteobacteria bacterium]